MATYAITDNSAAVSAGAKAYVQEAVLDFSTTNLAATQDIDIFSIPANTLVLAVGIRLETAGSNAATLDVGDGTAADTWVADLDADATAGEQGIGTTAKFYATADTIDMLAVAADFDGKIRAFAVMVPMGTAAANAAFA
jgi:predicted secreted protein